MATQTVPPSAAVSDASPTGRPPGRPLWRRLLAVAVLVGCGLLAWQTAGRRPREVAVSWLLTHVELQDGAAGRERLVGLNWRVGQADRPQQTAAAGSVRFAVGTAPEVTGPFAVRLPPGVHVVDVRCDFALAGSSVVSTRTVIDLPRDGGERWTVDVGSCGTLRSTKH